MNMGTNEEEQFDDEAPRVVTKDVFCFVELAPDDEAEGLLKKSASMPSRSSYAHFGILGTSSWNVLTLAKSRPKTSANL